jgi:glycogen(starch) synthase
VGNGVNLDEFNSTLKYQHQRPYVLSVGRFVQKKGFDILIQAFAKVTGKHPEVDLIIAGDGEELNRCKSLALQLGLNQKVFFLGAVDHQTVVELLLQCEIFVLPSRREPFGLVILEAMAAGKPVVATRVGGVPEIVSHLENGLLVEPDSPEELSKATCLLLDDPELGYDLARAGYELLKRHFTWQEVAERYINVCEKLLEA